LTNSVALSAVTKTIIQLLNSADHKKTGAVSTTIHKIFDKVEVGVSMIELLSIPRFSTICRISGKNQKKRNIVFEQRPN